MPTTRYADRLDTLIFREYESLAPEAVRTLLWANPTLGADLTPPVGTDYDAPAIDFTISFAPPIAEVDALRKRLDDGN